MVDLPALLRRIRDDLVDLGAAHVLVGGLAVSVRTEPRFTRDVDLAVVVEDDDEAESLVRELTARGWRVAETLEQDAVSRLAAVRLATVSPESGPVVDLLFASTGIEEDLVRRADQVEVLPGLTLPVASTADLVVLKSLAVTDDRPQDEQDLRALVGALDDASARQARAVARDVTDRGFARDRDLLAALDRRLPTTGGAGPFLHLALPNHWAEARRTGSYTHSTPTSTLDDIGFIHCSFAHQLEDTANEVFGDEPELVVLQVDPSQCEDAELRIEPGDGDRPGDFPHLYGPIPVDAVVATWHWHRAPDGSHHLMDLDPPIPGT